MRDCMYSVILQLSKCLLKWLRNSQIMRQTPLARMKWTCKQKDLTNFDLVIANFVVIVSVRVELCAKSSVIDLKLYFFSVVLIL